MKKRGRDAVALFEERLIWGSDPDKEFFQRCDACSRAFDEDELLRLRWLPRLREVARFVTFGGAELWRLAEPILSGRVEPNCSESNPTATIEPQNVESIPATSADASIAWEGYLPWRSETITDDAFLEAKKLAPARLREIIEIEERAEALRDPAKIAPLLRQAANGWADLMGVPRPQL